MNSKEQKYYYIYNNTGINWKSINRLRLLGGIEHLGGSSYNT
jgi:hypothetical protein